MVTFLSAYEGHSIEAGLGNGSQDMLNRADQRQRSIVLFFYLSLQLLTL